MPPRLSSICGALILICLSGAFLFPHSALESQTKGNRNNSASYAKQTIQDASPLLNNGIRSRFVAPVRGARLDYGIVQPLFLSTFPSPYAISLLVVDLPAPQSLAVFNPTTRSPPL